MTQALIDAIVLVQAAHRAMGIPPLARYALRLAEERLDEIEEEPSPEEMEARGFNMGDDGEWYYPAA